MVGVQLSTSTVPGPGAATRAPGSGYVVAGQTLRGNPNVPVMVESMQQFLQLFGGQVSYGYLWNDLSMFFGEGGTHAWVCRVVGTGALAGSITLQDGGGTPQPTLQLFAGCPSIDPVTGNSLGNVKDPGAWSSALQVQVQPSQLTGQYKITVFYNGIEVEQWGPFPDVATAVTKINGASSYLYAVNLMSTNTGAAANPAVIPATALSAGNDQRSTITSAMVASALSNVPTAIAAGLIAATPGYDASLTGAALQSWAVANSCLVHLSPTEGLTVTSVAASAASFRGTAGSEHSCYTWPWVLIPNGSGGTTIVPPDGFVAGVRSRTIADVGGPWQPPAGNYGVARYVIGLDPASGAVTDTVGDTLNDEHVNVIRPKNGIRLYGWRSLSTDMVNYALLTQADVLDNVAAQLSTVEQQYAFQVIDSLGQLGSELQNSAKQVLQPYITAGALYPGPTASNGQPSDPGYLLDTGPDVNTPQSIAQNQYGIAVYIRPAGAAEVIPVKVIKVAIGNAF
jgi:hypothetical protein